MNKRYDLVIRGGTVIDGSGAPPRDADVACLAGRIAGIGKFEGSGAEEISAKGLLVTPGFVDIHTHYDGQVTWEDTLSPSSVHGATTVVMGNCGVGFAPCRPDQREVLIKVMEGVEDIPGPVMAEGIPWEWETFPEYMNFLQQRKCDIDFATQVPHAPVRVYVMGQRGVDREPATQDDMRRMAQIVQEGVAAGALGFTTARTTSHRRKDGALAPTITAAEEELRAIALGLKAIGKGVIELIDDFNDTTEGNSTEFDMWCRIARESGRPVAFALAQVTRAPERWKSLLRLLEKATQAGLPMKAQVLSRPIGMLLGLDLSSHPFMNCPSYRKIAHLSLAARVAEMRKPEMRAKLLAEEPDSLSQLHQTRSVERMVEFVEPLTYFPPSESKLGVRARSLGISALELAYDLLLGKEGHAVLHHPLTNYVDSRIEPTRTMMLHPDTVIALGDGGAHVGMICDASVSTYLLTYWTRDTPEKDRVSLPWAIQALTRRPALAVGLEDRGLVAPGYKADLNLIDYDGLILHSPRMVADLPAGGRRLTQSADGYVATILNGIPTYREGRGTGALPGRLIRGAQPAP